MRRTLWNTSLAGIVATALFAFGTAPAKAQGYGGYCGGGGYGQGCGGGYSQGYGGYSQGYGGYGQGYGGYGQGYSGYSQGYGGGYNAPSTNYYGNGGHDFQPHWHTTQTPGGSFAWYGNGAHDLQPHEHTQSAYGGYRGYSPSPFGGTTTSYYNSTPYIYMPW